MISVLKSDTISCTISYTISLVKKKKEVSSKEKDKYKEKDNCKERERSNAR